MLSRESDVATALTTVRDFVRSYIERHPEHLDLVPAERLAASGLPVGG